MTNPNDETFSLDVSSHQEIRETSVKVDGDAGTFNVVNNTYHLGPLPSSAEIAEYERIYPGAAALLFEMANKEMEHRHFCDREKLELAKAEQEKENVALKMSFDARSGQIRVAGRGQITALIVYLAVVGAMCFCVWRRAYWCVGGLFILLMFLTLILTSGATSATTQKSKTTSDKNDLGTTRE